MMKIISNIALFAALGLCVYCWSCTNAQSKNSNVEGAKATTFSAPQVPITIDNPDQRADYLAEHYWDNFDFNDTTMISKPEITEQAFVDFINVLNYAPNPANGVKELLNSSMKNDAMFAYFTNLAEKYLYHPNSPMHNEDIYIYFLNYIVQADNVDASEKVRPQHQLEMIHKNRPGTIATDFAYTLANGNSYKLSALQSDYTILFFNNPDCEDCKRVKQHIASSPTILSYTGMNGKHKNGVTLSILAVYPDTDISLWKSAQYPTCMINAYDASQTIDNKKLYDLRAIPALYLLDKDKRIILKDASIETIEIWLQQHIDNL